MMNKDFFQEVILDEIRNRLPNDVDVKTSEVIKNNDKKLQCLSFTSEASNCSPVIYIDDIYNDYLSGTSVEDVADKAVDLYYNHAGSLDTTGFLNRDFILNNVFYKMRNNEMNTDSLNNVPTQRISGIDDIVLVPYIMLNLKNDAGKGYIKISNKLIDSIGISVEELDEAAKNNTDSSRFSVRKMSDLIGEMTGMQMEDNNFYVVLDSKNDSASIFADPDYADFISSKTGLDDYYIIPSSIHELIIVDAKDGGAEKLHAIISEVNVSMCKTDILSYNFYECKDGVVNTICADRSLENDMEL